MARRCGEGSSESQRVGALAASNGCGMLLSWHPCSSPEKHRCAMSILSWSTFSKKEANFLLVEHYDFFS